MQASPLVLVTVFSLSLMWGPSGDAAAQPRPAWHRWAVIASQDLQADGLPDLLTAELSRIGGLELVERERLDLAAKELEVAACFGSAAAGKRLQLGQWLGADGLLLLSIEQREQKKYVKVVISDCVYGARLWVEYLLYSAEDMPQVAKRAASVVHAARQQFAGGIRCIIAVSPFISRDLAHDFDHWQNGFAALVEQALMTVPGVAVLELEEARSIGQELGVTGGEVGERLVPLFVDGEYATSRTTPEAEPTVRLTIRVTHGDRRLETVSPCPVTEAEVVSVLAERLASWSEWPSRGMACPWTAAGSSLCWLNVPRRFPNWASGHSR